MHHRSGIHAGLQPGRGDFLDVANLGSWLSYLISTADQTELEISVSDYRKAQTRLQGSWRPFRGCPEARIESSLKLARLG